MALLPHGTILLWHGTIETIPTGYVLCDGNNGTPNLKAMFVQGAGGALTPGDTGGSGSHSHTFTTDGHNHTLPAGADIQAGVPWGTISTMGIDTGETTPTNNRPPWYALAYIMKT